MHESHETPLKACSHDARAANSSIGWGISRDIQSPSWTWQSFWAGCPGDSTNRPLSLTHTKAYVLSKLSKHRFELTSRALRVCCSPMDSSVMAWYLMWGSEALSRA